MTIRIWGVRGSIPTPGEQTNRYGGNTTCIEVRLGDGTLLVVDAGSGIRCLGNRLLEEDSITELYLFVTHSHWDHLMGFPFFVPAYLDRFRIHVRGGPQATHSLERFLAHQMEPPFFPVEFDVLKAKFDFSYAALEEQSIGSCTVLPVPLSHPNGGYGFRFVEEGKSFMFLTDNELGFQHKDGLTHEAYVTACRDVDLLLHDAQYTDKDYETKKGWGHSTFSAATDLAIEAGVKRLGLCHHDPDRTDNDMDAQVEACQTRIRSAEASVACFGVREGTAIVV